MSLLQIQNARLAFGRQTLFDDVTVSVSEGDRIGLVGNNGSGKSSLLNAVLGHLELDRGSITLRRNLYISYAPQAVPAELQEKTVRDVLSEAMLPEARESESWRVDLTLDLLGFPEDLKAARVSALSGGWQRLLLLARATMADPELLILDEPTNHLDLAKIQALEDWLQHHVTQPFILVSHDRQLLDNCCGKTWFLREDGLHAFAGGYSAARAELLAADADALRKADRDDKKIAQLERAAERMRIWANSKGINPKMARRAKGVRARADHIRANKAEVYRASQRHLDLSQGETRAKLLLRIEDAAIADPPAAPLRGGEALRSTGRADRPAGPERRR